MLFDVTLPNLLRQSHIRESAHLQSLFQEKSFGLADNQNFFSAFTEFQTITAMSCLDLNHVYFFTFDIIAIDFLW